jgi:hypothetical protein
MHILPDVHKQDGSQSQAPYLTGSGWLGAHDQNLHRRRPRLLLIAPLVATIAVLVFTPVAALSSEVTIPSSAAHASAHYSVLPRPFCSGTPSDCH